MIDYELYDAFIFDMDGTIMDSLSVWDTIDVAFLEGRRNIKVPDDYAHAISAMSFNEIAVYTKERFNLPDTPEELMAEWTGMAEYEYTHNIMAKKGVRDYMEKLRNMGKKIVLCTSSPKHFYEGALKNNDIYDLFDAFSNTCEAGEGKTSTKVYLLAAEKVGAEPSGCVVFEDIVSAAATAKKAGMTVCGVYDERSAVHKDAMVEICDYYINSFEELL